MSSTAVVTDRLEERMNALAATGRLVRFALRFVAPAEHELGRQRLAKWRPLHALGNAAASALQKKSIDHKYPESDEDVKDIIRQAVAEGVLSPHPYDWPREVFLSLYPHLSAQIIDTSNGYAMPDVAAGILADAKAGKENWCEWVYSCYGRSAVKCVQHALRQRTNNAKAAIADYPRMLAKAQEKGEPTPQRRDAYSLIDLKRGEVAVAKTLLGFEHLFASWF